MAERAEHATAEETRLALYLLGALDDGERSAFERHLAGCDRCLAEAADLGTLTSAFGLFSAAEAAEVIADADADADAETETDADTDADAGAEPTAPAPEHRRPASGARPAPAPSPARPAPGRGSRPTRRVPRPRPPGRGDRSGGVRRPGRLVAWAATAAAAVAAIAAVVLVVQGVDPVRPPGTVLVATGEAPGVSLAVTVTGNPRGSTAEATITGLSAGTRYRLYVVTRDGATHVVRDWDGSAETQRVTGELTEPVESLAFFTVGPVDGAPVVTAAVQPRSAAPPTR
ncbi:zf-HC2 domain-containing protein [Plantactinospora sp. KBS50]|uniref:zf-HC2 domain-containing protein n=1 Tax=Plantactinospora sp. KBS50 TaxID=2024580 RepID=UPI000BAAAEDE|nr:zf-HC2 domain-containing protein [Plantactinospora sp. KBS50]ASW53428.1 hypothetical protein CIK06_03350 [Plantactinospora sp. KBS50]